MARYVNPFPQYLNISGAPIVGGFLKFFITGTSNTKNVFSDSTFATSIGSEVRLSASGRIPDIFLNGAYKVTLTDASGNELDSADPIGVDTDITNFDLWLISNTYNIPDVVKGSDNLYYQSLANSNLGNNPVSSPALWEQFYFLPTWNTAQTYRQGQLAIASDGRTYQSQLGSNTGNNPTLDNGTNWRILLQSNDTITAAGLIIDKIEAGSAGLSYVNASNQRWNWFFDTDESIKLNRFNSSAVLQNAVMSFDNTTGAMTTIGNLTVTTGNVIFTQVGAATAQTLVFNSDAAQENTITLQDAGVKRWVIGQDSTNGFRLQSFTAAGAAQNNVIDVVNGSANILIEGNINFKNTAQGLDVVSANGGSMDFNFSGADTDNIAFDYLNDTTTTGTRLFNIWKGNVTNAITFQIIAETGTIHPSFDRAGETNPGVKLGKITLSSNAPTGGEDGDLWLRF